MNKNLRIIFTSDIHGYFFNTDYMDREIKPQGLLHLATRYNKDDETLIIDGGDMLQGSPFTYFSKLENSPDRIACIMNKVGYDFVTIGNHDFNYGYEYFKKYLEYLDAECVCENCLNEEGNPIYPYKIVTMKNGLKVGIVGCVTEFVNFWETPKNLGEVSIGNIIENLKRAYEEMKDEVDITICVYHGGFECDIDTKKIIETSGENVGLKICNELNFDVLLTGHQHVGIKGRYLNNTYIVQNLFNAMSFHDIKITRKNGKNIIDSEMIFAKDIPFSNEILPFHEENERVQDFIDDFVGELDEELLPDTHLNMALNGSKLADFINKIQIEYTGADISSTSFANRVSGLPKKVKIRDILLTYPFSNTLVVLEITGKNLKRVLERSAEYFDVKDGEVVISERFLKPKIEHYNYDYYMGVDYKINYAGDIGNRVYDIKVKGKELSDNDIFTICLNSYRAKGTGGYFTYNDCKVVKKYDEEMFEILMEYVKNFQKNKNK